MGGHCHHFVFPAAPVTQLPHGLLYLLVHSVKEYMHHITEAKLYRTIVIFTKISQLKYSMSVHTESVSSFYMYLDLNSSHQIWMPQ